MIAMSLDKIFVLLFSALGFVLTYWFFLMKKEDVKTITSDTVEIIVNGGYQPESISIPKNKTTRINFLRKDPSSCLEDVVLPDFKIKKYLPLNKEVGISITPNKVGEYEIVCGMGMFHGKIKVR